MFWTFLKQAIHFSAIFIFGSTGEILTEKGGHLNLGIPGIMCLGATGGVFGAVSYMKAAGDNVSMFWILLIPIILSMLFAAFGGLIYGIFTISLRCNQNVTGLTLTTFGGGVLSFYLAQLGNKGISIYEAVTAFRTGFPFAEKLGTFGDIVFDHGILIYLAFFVAICAAIFLNKTRRGMHLVAIGENPAAADAAGINVTRYKYLSSTIGASISGLGGLFFIIDYVGSLSGALNATITAMGWLAIALVIFCVWKPSWAILGSIFFSALYIMPNYISIASIPADIIKMIPYIATLVILIILSIVDSKENQPPQSLGLSYFREER